MELPRVEDIELRKGMSVDELVRQLYKAGGFTAKDLALAVDIIEDMIEDDDAVVFLSFPACILSLFGVRLSLTLSKPPIYWPRKE